MLESSKNNTNTIQHFLDANGNPQKVDLGETITFLGQGSKPISIDGLDVISEAINGEVVYIGYCVNGTAENEAGWAIKKRFVVGNTERWKWAGEGFVLRYRWDERTSLNY